MYSVSELTQRLREKLALSQDDLAGALGVSDGNAVSRWEKGRRVPDEVVRRLLRYLEELPKSDAEAVLKRFRRYEKDKQK